MDKLWIRDSDGNPIEIRDIWIRDQGQARQISDMWIRNSSGTTERVYPNTTPEAEETEIVIFNQGTSLQLPSVRYDQVYNSTTWSTNIENSYRNLGVKFGMNTGVGASGSTGTLITAAQQAFSGVITAWNDQTSTSPTTPFNWDWGVSINIENGTSVAAIMRGGKNTDDVIPLNYNFFNRSGTINTQTQQVIDTIQHYYPEATNETITYHQLHDSCLRANNDVAVWLSQQIPTARRANWWKSASNPISLIGSGWWNNNNPVTLDADGTPPSGLDYDYQQAAQGLRTILGNQLYRVENGTEVRLPDPLSAWSYGMSSYPYGTYQARANSVAFEQCDNSSGIEDNVDIVVHQSYFPVYPIERTLDSIPNNGYTFIGNNALVNGFTSSGDRYIIQPDAILALKKTTRVNWFANWKKFKDKASIGTELCFDYGGFANNRFSGLAMDVFDYYESVVKGILDKVTEEESILYSIPQEYVGKRLIPKYWTFWTAGYFYLSLMMSWSNNGQTYHGRGSFSELSNPDALYRSRSNVEWRFSNLACAPSINWLEGSQWHGFICSQLDLFGIERCQLVKEQIEIARQDN